MKPGQTSLSPTSMVRSTEPSNDEPTKRMRSSSKTRIPSRSSVCPCPLWLTIIEGDPTRACINGLISRRGFRFRWGGMRSPAAQRHQRRRAEEAFEPVVVEAHAKAMADQARRYRIEHLLEDEPAGRRDRDDGLLVIRRPARRQRLQGRALEIEPLGVARVAPPDNFIDEATVGIQGVEVARAAQQQRIFDRLLEMAVRAFNRTVLVRYAAIVAGRLHAVMRAQRLV